MLTTFLELNPAGLIFSVYLDMLGKAHVLTLTQTLEDAYVISDVLDVSRVTVGFQDLREAIRKRAASQGESGQAETFQRTQSALRHLKLARLVRPVKVHPGWQGWVWNGPDVTDDEWRERSLNPEAATAFRKEAQPLQAFVTVVS